METQSTKSPIKHAQLLFKGLLVNNKLQNFKLAGQQGSLTLSMVNDATGLLPSWMLRSDEIAVALLGKRLWDCVYRYNENSLVGVSVEPFPKTDINLNSYLRYPVANNEQCTNALRSIICALAMRELLNFDHKTRSFSVVSNVGYYPKQPQRQDQYIEFADEEYITAYMAQVAMDQSISRVPKRVFQQEPKHQPPQATID